MKKIEEINKLSLAESLIVTIVTISLISIFIVVSRGLSSVHLSIWDYIVLAVSLIAIKSLNKDNVKKAFGKIMQIFHLSEYE